MKIKKQQKFLSIIILIHFIFKFSFQINSLFNLDNKTIFSRKNIKHIKNLVKMPITNNQKDLMNDFGKNNFLKTFLEKKSNSFGNKEQNPANQDLFFQNKEQFTSNPFF